MNNSLIIFTDLDGTLLDSDYSFKKALPALTQIKKNHIPLIFCSSKTKAEIEHYRKKLKNTHPFISENGGGIFIPKGYFIFRISNFRFQIKEEKKYYVIKLGASYPDLRKALDELRLEGFDVRGFGDMSIKEVAEVSGLKTNEARMAKQRNFAEPFMFPHSSQLLKGGEEGFLYSSTIRKLKQSIEAKGFNFTQGEFFNIMGDSNKGRAVEILIKLYTKQYHQLITAAIGDSPNDIEMLEKVDYPIAVKKRNGNYDSQLTKRLKQFIKADGIGPEGWNKAVLRLLELHGL